MTEDMTTARDVIFSDDLTLFVQEAKETAAYASTGRSWEHDFLSALLSAPNSVRQELAALLSPCRSINPWRPIDTAPKDGTLILACWKGSGMYPIITRWLKNVQGWSHPFNKPVHDPTHWLPLPAPPSEDKT